MSRRIRNSALNMITGLGSTLLLVFLNFFTRSVFIRTLGTSYLGIEGLFSNVLYLLSLAELGFGQAIVFKLYKPIEEKDTDRILVLMKLYRKAYFIIGSIIAGAGVCLMPLLPYIIKDYAKLAALNLNAPFIFLLYLFNTVSSYWFFAYKRSFIRANQKAYVLTIVGYAINVADAISQILILTFCKNFLYYLCVKIAFSILANLIYAHICDRRYPFLKEKTTGKISREEVKDFWKDCTALLIYKVSGTVITTSDNLVLSTVLGLEAVGLYANYISIKSSLKRLLHTFLDSIRASMGSLYSVGNLEWSRRIYRVVHLCVAILYGIGGVGMAVLSDEFMTLWLGREFVVSSWQAGDAVIHTPLGLLIGIEIYVAGMVQVNGLSRTTMGLFQQLKFRPILSIFVNLGVCILLVPRIGIAGCVVSTIAAHCLVNLIVDPVIIHKYALKASVAPYFLRNAWYAVVVVAGGLASWLACRAVSLAGWLGFFVHGFLCVGITGGIMMLAFWKTEEFRYLLDAAKPILSRVCKLSKQEGR